MQIQNAHITMPFKYITVGSYLAYW